MPVIMSRGRLAVCVKRKTKKKNNHFIANFKKGKRDERFWWCIFSCTSGSHRSRKDDKLESLLQMCVSVAQRLSLCVLAHPADTIIWVLTLTSFIVKRSWWLSYYSNSSYLTNGMFWQRWDDFFLKIASDNLAATVRAALTNWLIKLCLCCFCSYHISSVAASNVGFSLKISNLV